MRDDVTSDAMTPTVTSPLLLLLVVVTQVVVVTSVFQSSSGVASEFRIAEELPAGTLVGSVRDNPQLQPTDAVQSHNAVSLKITFLPRDAMLARYMLWLRVRRSVCPSQAGIVSQRLNAGSREQSRALAEGF